MFSVANVSNTYHEQVITYHSFYSTQIVSKAMTDKTSIVLTRLSISFEIGIKTGNCLDCSCTRIIQWYAGLHYSWWNILLLNLRKFLIVGSLQNLLMFEQVCDGENDCSDHESSDELNCTSIGHSKVIPRPSTEKAIDFQQTQLV